MTWSLRIPNHELMEKFESVLVRESMGEVKKVVEAFRHGGVTRGGHGQSPVRRAVIYRDLGVFSGHEAVDQAGSEGVAATCPVHDLLLAFIFSAPFYRA